ncbi:glutathione S-transferase [Pseudoxanthomonas winnipegensis]|uniref:Glutathione S-transferase n=2 Tax=Pseudoxanthomonas winnipegensis TaxID=2480810 RepID=A0ABY1WGX9_9GAMM|nr:glutathione S-transferase [Pseudoxanthomonas winnipegensis]TAA21203.1 glutathione S-transferase [Pseudoxanthomonas winnipegensis]TAH72696.1 glutathione S-transferase [Pseudoxanthomonas winnipegensis]
MQLIGLLDSPYVRRVAISFSLQGLRFDHQPLSVFSTFDAFAAINPIVKAPTLVNDDGTVLIDSGLILDLGERLAAPDLRLIPSGMDAYVRSQRVIGLALAACEKTVQIVYERKLRPAEKQHQPWVDRVQGQLVAAYRLLEAEVARANPWLFDGRPLQADVTSAVAFRFSREMLPGIIDAEAYPALSRLSAHAEATEAFSAFPYA